MSNEYLVLNFETITEQIQELAHAIKNTFKPEILIGISRGGLIITRLLSDYLHQKKVMIIGIGFYTDINTTAKQPTLLQDISEDITNKRVLLIDDVADSGKSLEFAVEYLKTKGVKEIRSVTLHYKPKSIFKPDYFIDQTTKWIVYPWEQAEFAELFLKKKLAEGLAVDDITTMLRKLAISDKVLQLILRK